MYMYLRVLEERGPFLWWLELKKSQKWFLELGRLFG